jgi:hypothetical protein
MTGVSRVACCNAAKVLTDASPRRSAPERREQPRVIVRLVFDTREIDIMAKLNTDARNKLPARDFAEPKKRAYPIEDEAHARNAKARASQAAKAGRMSKAEEDKIDKKADAVLKKS